MEGRDRMIRWGKLRDSILEGYTIEGGLFFGLSLSRYELDGFQHVRNNLWGLSVTFRPCIQPSMQLILMLSVISFGHGVQSKHAKTSGRMFIQSSLVVISMKCQRKRSTAAPVFPRNYLGAGRMCRL